MTKTLDKRFLALFALTIVFVTYMALNPQPPATPLDRYGDKTQHMCAFATLAVLARLAFPQAGKWRIVERLSFYGALIEVFQNIPSLHRTCDWADWTADTIALIAAIHLFDALLGWWRSRHA